MPSSTIKLTIIFFLLLCSSSSSYSGSSTKWFCLAKSSDGSCGYSFDYDTESDAKYRALQECKINARGVDCNIKYCSKSAPGDNPCSSRDNHSQTNTQYNNQ